MIIKPSSTISENPGIDVFHALREIEDHHNIRIIQACIVGSRAHGIDNRETGRSDWDVRFVFVNSPDDYVSINSKTSSVGLGSPKSLTGKTKLDVYGWELGTFLNCLKLSKFNQCELMYTLMLIPEFTDMELLKKMRDLADRSLNPATLLYSVYGFMRHYEAAHVSKGNNGGANVYKRLLNMQRLYVTASFIVDYASSGHVGYPPVNMSECLEVQKYAIKPEDLAWVAVGKGKTAIEVETEFLDKYMPNVEKWCKFVKSRDDLVPKLPSDSEFDAMYRGAVFAPSLKYGPEREAMLKMLEDYKEEGEPNG